MDRIAQFLDEAPLLKLFASIVTEGPGMLAGKIGGALSKMGDAMGAAMDSVGGGAITDWMKGGSDRSVAAVEPERTPSKEITAPAKSLGTHDVDPADIGNFSAPTFAAVNQTRSTGISV